MIIDINTWLGHYPFQKLAVDNAAKLSKELKSAGINKAYVSSINAVFYADPDLGNMELAAEIKKYISYVSEEHPDQISKIVSNDQTIKEIIAHISYWDSQGTKWIKSIVNQ